MKMAVAACLAGNKTYVKCFRPALFEAKRNGLTIHPERDLCCFLSYRVETGAAFSPEKLGLFFVRIESLLLRGMSGRTVPL